MFFCERCKATEIRYCNCPRDDRTLTLLDHGTTLADVKRNLESLKHTHREAIANPTECVCGEDYHKGALHALIAIGALVEDVR